MNRICYEKTPSLQRSEYRKNHSRLQQFIKTLRTKAKAGKYGKGKGKHTHRIAGKIEKCDRCDYLMPFIPFAHRFFPESFVNKESMCNFAAQFNREIF